LPAAAPREQGRGRSHVPDRGRSGGRDAGRAAHAAGGAPVARQLARATLSVAAALGVPWRRRGACDRAQRRGRKGRRAGRRPVSGPELRPARGPSGRASFARSGTGRVSESARGGTDGGTLSCLGGSYGQRTGEAMEDIEI